MSDTSPLRVVFIGWGAISTTVAASLSEPSVHIVGVARRSSTVDTSIPPTAARITHPDQLAALRPHVIVEAAGRESVGQWGAAALATGARLIVSSVSAFADDVLFASLSASAAAHNTCLEIHPGALAGIDALSAARAVGIDSVTHRIIKPPQAWVDTPAETLCDLHTLSTATEFYVGSAADTATEFPKNANVAMTTALAGIGPQLTRIVCVADPLAASNRHEIAARGAFGSLNVTSESSPLPANPKTSAMAAYSLRRAIINQANAVVI